MSYRFNGRMKERPSDLAFSWYIRERDNWTCRRCKRYYEPPTKSLQCSHYFGRTRENVRFDPENCVALCAGCHPFWEKEDREAYREFMLEWLGARRLESLTARSRIKGYRDDKLERIKWDEARKRLLAEKNAGTFGAKQ